MVKTARMTIKPAGHQRTGGRRVERRSDITGMNFPIRMTIDEIQKNPEIRMSTRPKEPFELPPLFLGWPTESGRETRSGNGLLSCPCVLLRRGQIFEVLADEFGSDTLVEQRQHFDCAQDPSGENGDLFAGADIASGLYLVSANLHMARVAGLGCQRSSPV